MNNTIDTGLLYSRVIENDGHIGYEPTVLGVVLGGLCLFAFAAVLIFVVPLL